MTFVMREGITEQAFFEILTGAAAELGDPMDLVYPAEVPYFEKYDELVPEELVRKGFALGTLDVAGMKARVRQWANERGIIWAEPAQIVPAD